MASCSLQDIIARFSKSNAEWSSLPGHVAIQMNDTHPAMAVAELMRILPDQAGLPWEMAWDITVRTLSYTNHTLLPESLEGWPIDLFEILIPSQLEVIYEINRRHLDDVRRLYLNDDGRLQRMS
jgi:starch phosphorylase